MGRLALHFYGLRLISPLAVRKCACVVPPDDLRSEISFSHTCQTPATNQNKSRGKTGQSE